MLEFQIRSVIGLPEDTGYLSLIIMHTVSFNETENTRFPFVTFVKTLLCK